jgi:hypothetical protein
MTVGVCIPWRPAPSRERHLPLVLAHFAETLPGATPYLADAGGAIFSRSASLNLAARRATDDGCDILVLSDADMVLDGDLPATVRFAAQDGRAHLPYTGYVGLSRAGTDRFHQDGYWLPDEVDYATEGSCSGFMTMLADTYWQLGGHDETYRGWGYEDVDFAIRAQFVRHPGACVALWHEVAADRATRAPVNLAYFRSKHGNV